MICTSCRRDVLIVFGAVESPVCWNCSPEPKPKELDCVAYEDMTHLARPRTEVSYPDGLPREHDLENHMVLGELP